MPGEFTLHYLPAAQRDLLEAYDFIAKDSPRRALSFIEKLDRKITVLKRFPYFGRVPRQSRVAKRGFRVLIVESHLAFYKIKGTRIEIHRVLHGSRNIEALI